MFFVRLKQADVSHQSGYWKSKEVDHVVHLVGKILQPVLYAFNTCDHSGEFVSNNRLGVKGLAECFPLVSPPRRGGDQAHP